MALPQTKSDTAAKAIAGITVAAVLAIATPFVSGLEGRSLIAYLDSGGVPTICNGETHDVKLGQTRTDAECDKLLAGSLGHALAVVDKEVKVPLNAYQHAGIASFVYNIGETGFRKSTMLKRLNAGKLAEACDRLKDWVYVKGKDCRIAKNKCTGIVRRRDRERQYCLGNKNV